MRGRKTAKTGRQPGGREKEDSGRKHLTRLDNPIAVIVAAALSAYDEAPLYPDQK
jgi:hypothetical protein